MAWAPISFQLHHFAVNDAALRGLCSGLRCRAGGFVLTAMHMMWLRGVSGPLRSMVSYARPDRQVHRCMKVWRGMPLAKVGVNSLDISPIVLSARSLHLQLCQSTFWYHCELEAVSSMELRKSKVSIGHGHATLAHMDSGRAPQDPPCIFASLRPNCAS